MPRQRNSQYGKFWAAQSTIDSHGRDFTAARALPYIKKAQARVFLLRRYPSFARSFRVDWLPRNHRERGDYWSIGIPEGKYDECTIIYCLARVIWSRESSSSRDGREWAYTGWQWASIYLDLVHALMGKPAADLLKAAYQVHGVRWKPKKKVTVTPAMLERLAAARAKKGSDHG
jgi:hypothetical protein